MRRLLILFVVVIVLAFVGYFGAGYLVYNQLSPVSANCGGSWASYAADFTPADFTPQYNDNITDATAYLMPDYQEVEFPSREAGSEITIRAFFVAADSDEAVILVHGVNSCRRNPEVLLPAGMLHNNGYNVLIIDMRNHGDSEVINGRTTVGNTEWHDVAGAYDWLGTQGFAEGHIGLVGISLGGATSLNAFGQEQGIAALWVDSTFSDINELLSAELARNSYPVFLKDAALLVASLGGANLTEYSPLESIGLNNNRPVFITHGTIDTRLSVDYATDLYNAAGENAELWIVDGTDHVEAVFRYPDDYNQRLNSFFDNALRNTLSEPSS